MTAIKLSAHIPAGSTLGDVKDTVQAFPLEYNSVIPTFERHKDGSLTVSVQKGATKGVAEQAPQK